MAAPWYVASQRIFADASIRFDSLELFTLQNCGWVVAFYEPFLRAPPPSPHAPENGRDTYVWREIQGRMLELEKRAFTMINLAAPFHRALSLLLRTLARS